jgi:hypothetical protein
MEDVLAKMPPALSKHIESLMNISGFDTDPVARKKFIRNWLKKKAFFDKIVEHQGFRLTERIEPGSKEGIIILTYSGSLLTLSPEEAEGKREMVYNSIEMRKDVVVKTEDKAALVVFPIEIHKPMESRTGKIKKTSPVLSMAIEEAPPANDTNGNKRMRTIGELIAKAFLIVNKELFAKHAPESELDEHDDLFDKWIILTWFRIGGWEEAVFYERARILWLELFTKSYAELAKKIKSRDKLDPAMLALTNTLFGKFIDDYKWLESEKKNFDIGLMKALEEIPGRNDYEAFVKEKVLELGKA